MSQSNRLMKKDYAYYYEYCLGGKTGYTSKAKYTFVCYGEKDSRTVIAVVLRSPLTDVRFASGRNLLKYGLENFRTLDLSRLLAGETMFAQVKGALEDPDAISELEVSQVARTAGTVTIRLREGTTDLSSDGYRSEVQWKDGLRAPVAQGTALGSVTYYSKESGEPVLTCDLIAARDLLAWNQTEIIQTESEETGVSSTVPVVSVIPDPPAKENKPFVWILVAIVLLVLLILVIILLLLVIGRRTRRQNPGKGQESTGKQLSHYANRDLHGAGSTRRRNSYPRRPIR